MVKYLCKEKYNMAIKSFDEVPTYNALLDMWEGAGFRVLSFEEAVPYLNKIKFKNSPYKIESEANNG